MVVFVRQKLNLLKNGFVFVACILTIFPHIHEEHTECSESHGYAIEISFHHNESGISLFGTSSSIQHEHHNCECCQIHQKLLVSTKGSLRFTGHFSNFQLRPQTHSVQHEKSQRIPRAPPLSPFI